MSKLATNKPCPECGRFANRGVSVDIVIIRGGQVLLVKRGVEPGKGFWATPGGYVEWNESAEDAAKREVQEETGLILSGLQLVGVYSSPERHPNQVINILYLAKADQGDPEPGDDAEAAEWFNLDNLPEQMAFDHKQNVIDAQRSAK